MPTASSARAARRSTSSPRPSTAAWAAPSCSPSSTRTITSPGASRACDTPTGDFRVKAVPERIVQLAGTADLRLGPRPLWLQEGPRWEHCYRAALERDRRARGGPRLRVQGRPRARVVHRPGLRRAGGGAPRARLQPERDARREPSSSRELLADLDANGLGIGQIHAEYGWSQLELSLDASRSAHGGRRPAARARDDSRRVALQRPALVLRAADHARRRRQRLALPRLDPQGRPQPAVGRQRRRRA